jgi:hypothetical protein
MAESNEPENPHPSDSNEPEPHHHSDESDPTESDIEGEEHEGEPIDPDLRTGFSGEQRRFLWTLTGLNVVAVLLGVAIVVGYLATARSQDAAVVRLGDEANTAQTRWHQTESRDMQMMIAAKLAGNEEVVENLRQQAYEAYRDFVEKEVAWRRAQGLTAEVPTEEQLEVYLNRLNSDLAENVRRYIASTQPATQPATKPATRPATKPAAAKKTK